MPILPFWNSQSLIYNILLFKKYAMNGMTEIEEIECKRFFKSVSTLEKMHFRKLRKVDRPYLMI